MNSTISHNALQCAPVQKIESASLAPIEASTNGAPDLCARLRALSVGSDQYEYLDLIKDLASAPDQTRRDVASWCDSEIAEFDACILNNNA